MEAFYRRNDSPHSTGAPVVALIRSTESTAVKKRRGCLRRRSARRTGAQCEMGSSVGRRIVGWMAKECCDTLKGLSGESEVC